MQKYLYCKSSDDGGCCDAIGIRNYYVLNCAHLLSQIFRVD